MMPAEALYQELESTLAGLSAIHRALSARYRPDAQAAADHLASAHNAERIGAWWQSERRRFAADLADR